MTLQCIGLPGVRSTDPLYYRAVQLPGGQEGEGGLQVVQHIHSFLIAFLLRFFLFSSKIFLLL